MQDERYYCMKVEMIRRYLESIGLVMPVFHGDWKARYEQARNYASCFVLEAH